MEMILYLCSSGLKWEAKGRIVEIMHGQEYAMI